MKNLFVGREYYVSDVSEERALHDKKIRKFACYDEFGRACFQNPSPSEFLVTYKYNYVVEMPQRTIAPWTIETFPLEAPVWVQSKLGGTIKSVTSFSDNYVWLDNGGYVSYTELRDTYNRIMPNKTIVPCGAVG